MIKRLAIVFFILCCIPLNAYALDAFEPTIWIGLYLFILLIITLICREIICWYFKINELVSLLKEIRDSSKRNDAIRDSVLNNNDPPKDFPRKKVKGMSDEELNELRKTAGDDAVTFAYSNGEVWLCVCGVKNDLDINSRDQFCINCGRGRNVVLENFQRW